ncbi:MAG: hypothetical protein HC895_03290 [Leptolyngbyaceae cyanobacterium SM1_3_5]|nr:hypothetical protein [Leptolyngbyaceae cyanobacterium SM1_3_5]
MNYRNGLIALLSAVLTVSIAPAKAQDIDSRPEDSSYGAAVFGRWLEGGRLEERGDFNSAQIQYQRALDAARQLSNPQLRD